MGKDRSSLNRVEEEHRELRALVGKISSHLEEDRGEPRDQDAQGWSATLAEMLVQLHHKLFLHFRGEEGSGALDELVERFPRAHRAIEVLRSDHDRILEDLRAVLSSAVLYAGGRPPEVGQLRHWTQTVLDELSRHEHEETDLIQRLHTQDLGVGD
jgi:hypothetical protein